MPPVRRTRGRLPPGSIRETSATAPERPHTSDALTILHRRYSAGRPEREAALPAERVQAARGATRRLRIRSLRSGWVDRDTLLLHVAFQALQDFVEQEQPARTAWQADPTHARAWREIRALYRWWTRTRPGRRSRLDTQGLRCPPVEQLVEYDRKTYAAYERASRRYTQLKRRWQAEDQRNLHRLIEIRPFLWT